MTVSSSARRAGPFNGNGSSFAFPFTFKVFSAGDLAVFLTDPSGVQTQTSNILVVVNPDQDASPGGTVNYPLTGGVFLPAGWKLDIVGAVDYTQGTDLTNLGRFLPDVIEKAFDRLTILAQQLREWLGRAISFPVGDTASATLPAAAQRAGAALVFDDAGNVGVSPNIGATLATITGSATAAAASQVAAAASAMSAGSSAATANASQLTAAAAAVQATLLAGVTSVYDTYASMNTAAAGIAANASVMVLADEQRQGQTSVYKKLSGVMTYQGVIQYYGAVTSGVGDVNPENTIYLFPGDSTTEQAGASNYLFDTLTSEHRAAGGALARIGGTINFGGSGHKLIDWVTGAAAALPVYSTSNLGAGSNDYYGHKAAGAITLATQLAWRANLSSAYKVVWLPCYGINDCILDATVGNLSQQGITDYIAGYLRQAIRQILAAFPKDKIILRVPNPMTARPFTSYPSAAQYPSYGTNLANDQALVEKWNQAIRNGYFAVRNEFPGVSVYDKWELVYGRSDTTLTATTQLPFLQDSVHPKDVGYREEARTLVSFLAPDAPVTKSTRVIGRYAEAEARATALGVNPWEVWPPYLNGNANFELIAEGNYVARGGAFFDIGTNVADFLKIVRGRPVYVQVGEAAAQYFPSYSVTDLGGLNTTARFLSVSPSAAMQAAAAQLPVRIYADRRTIRRQYGVGMEHTQNARCFLTIPEQLPNGGTFSAFTGTAVPSTVTVEVYKFESNLRTLLGTISIGVNGYIANLGSGNPTGIILPGATYEFKLTSTTVAGGTLIGYFTPG